MANIEKEVVSSSQSTMTHSSNTIWRCCIGYLLMIYFPQCVTLTRERSTDTIPSSGYDERSAKFESIRNYRRRIDIGKVVNATTDDAETTTTNSRRFDQSVVDDEKLFFVPGTRYTLISPSKVSKTLLHFQSTYPNLIKVTTSQKEYGLMAAYQNAKTDCPYDINVTGCLNYFAIIHDNIVHPIGSTSYKSLPTILWSGELHGDERVGPTAVIEATRILLHAATCESYTNRQSTQAVSCRKLLKSKYGITDDKRMWLARLVTTRRIIVIPTANAVGYYRNDRYESGIDMNRDFPYDIRKPALCMQTIGARTLNELFRSYIVQLALTYHGGTECIAYEWGATSWIGYASPDDISQNRISYALRQYAGKFRVTGYYPIGPSNELVYDIRGGMEDWAYAGSWDPRRVIQCNPSTWGGYSRDKTIYDEADLRVFNILVETSFLKNPLRIQLGTDNNVLSPTSRGNGHVPRNIRVSLLTADLVEPYVTIRSINSKKRERDLIPLQSRNGLSCRTKSSNIVDVSLSTTKFVKVQWIVGGGLSVNSTKMWHAKWDDVPSLYCLTQPPATITNQMKAGTMIGSTAGNGRYTASGKPTVFQASFDITASGYSVGDEIVILISTTVDQKWKQGVASMGPNISPQSHIVNARTNTSWYYSNSNDYRVQGRVQWFSTPLTIKIIS
jgi:Zinc carboxypeptidase